MQAFHDFVEPVDPDYPFRSYADILIKHPLQHPLAEVEAGGNIIHGHDFAVDAYFIHNLASEHGGFIALRHVPAKKVFGRVDFHKAIVEAEHGFLEILCVRAEKIVERDGAAGQSGERRLQKRIKPTRPEFHSKDLSVAFKKA